MIGWYATHTWQAVICVVIIGLSMGFGFIPTHGKPIWQRLLISACCLVVFGLAVHYLSQGLDWVSAPFGSNTEE